MNKVQLTEIMKLHHPDLSGRQYELFIEMAADRIAEETNIYKRTEIISSIAGQRFYNFPRHLLQIDKVSFNDVFIPRLVGEVLIDDDEFGTNSEDTADTALATPSANAENERFWFLSPYKKYTAASTSAEKVFSRIGIVEKVKNAVSRDGRTSDYQTCSITGTYNIRVYGSWIPERFTQSAAGTDQTDAMLDYHGPLSAIPEQFHEILVMGAIAYAYKFPPKIDMKIHQVFMDDFLQGIKRIRKWTRTKQASGFIKAQDF
tara:strand:+ start:4468 stop:5247 length:780 start_codon:yes stop_codon:yes gene_type:complete